MERDQRRRQRDLQARLRAMQKAQDHANKQAIRQAAELEVEEFESRMEVLTSMHREAHERVDWSAIACTPAPILRQVTTEASDQARAELEAYNPGFFGRLFGAKRKRAALAEAYDAAVAGEQFGREKAAQDFAREQAAWKEAVALAEAVLAGDVAAYARVVDESGCLEELAEIGVRIEAEFPSSSTAVVRLRTDGAEVVPNEIKAVTARGVLSTKAMPKTRFWEIYQDFVCGVALRAAREVCSVLPLRGTVAHVSAPVLNQGTGHNEDRVVLSVYCPASDLERINFDKADPSSVVERLKHAMAFSRGKGMEPVDPISVTESA